MKIDLMTNATSPQAARFGCDELGRLRRAMLHRPGPELRLINASNFRQWQFDCVPDVERFVDEHDRYTTLLRSHGVEVIEVADHVTHQAELARRLPNLTYMHDIAVVSRRGAILSQMTFSRSGEERVVREALQTLGIPLFSEFDGDPADAFEGCLLLSPQTLMVAETERHQRRTVEKFIVQALQSFEEVIYVNVPKARRFMHADTVYGRIRPDLALAYLPALGRASLHRRGEVTAIDFAGFMRRRGTEIIEVSDSEQRRLACSFVPLASGVIFHYDTAMDDTTIKELEHRGVELILFHPDAMTAGGGSLRCLTMRLWRATA